MVWDVLSLLTWPCPHPMMLNLEKDLVDSSQYEAILTLFSYATCVRQYPNGVLVVDISKSMFKLGLHDVEILLS